MKKLMLWLPIIGIFALLEYTNRIGYEDDYAFENALEVTFWLIAQAVGIGIISCLLV